MKKHLFLETYQIGFQRLRLSLEQYNKQLLDLKTKIKFSIKEIHHYKFFRDPAMINRFLLLY